MLFRLVTKWQFWAVVAMLLIPVASVQADVIPGWTYSYVTAPTSTGSWIATTNDASCTALSDGVSGAGHGYWASTNVNWQAPSNPDIKFDLHGSYKLEWMQLDYNVLDGALAADCVGGWDSLTIKMSNNADMSSPVFNHTYTASTGLDADHGFYTSTVGGSTNAFYGGNIYPHDLYPSVAAMPAARYVELSGVAHGGWGSMMDEVYLAGTASSTPEPGTCVLLVTGLVGLLAYAWRKRK